MSWLARHRAHIAAGVLAGLLLAGVFMAYMNPHLMVELADRIWACF